MTMKEEALHLELLMGKPVFGPAGERIGRIEEVVAEVGGSDCFVEEFHAGAYAVFERLSAWTIGRAFLKLLGAEKGGRSYRIPWDKLDLSDPERPQLLCPVSELERLS